MSAEKPKVHSDFMPKGQADGRRDEKAQLYNKNPTRSFLRGRV